MRVNPRGENVAAAPPRRRTHNLLLAIALVGWISAGAGCDLVAPKDRPFNGSVQPVTVGPIDASALVPGQHMAGVWTLTLDSLSSVHTANPPSRAELYVDSTLMATAISPPFALTLDTHRAAAGPHFLIVLVHETSPSTGLVGAVGAPSQILSTGVVFDQRPPTPVTLNSVVWENDRPRLDWTVNADANFAEYQVVREGNTTPGPTRPIRPQTTHTFLDSVGLRTLIGVRYDYRVNVDNRNEVAPSNTVSLRNGDVVPGLVYRADAGRPVPIPNRAEFYTYGAVAQESLKVYSTATNQLVRAFRPVGGTLAVTRDGNTLVHESEVMLGGIPGIASYSMDTFAPITSARVNVRFNSRAMCAPRDDRAVVAGFDGLYTVRVSDGTVLDTLALHFSNAILALSPDGGTLYAAAGDSVFRIDVSSDDAQVLARRQVSFPIADLQLSPDGLKLYLGHTIVSPSNFVEILDAPSLATSGSLTPPGNEWFYAFWITQNHLYLSHGRQDLPGRFYLPGTIVQYDRTSLAQQRSWDFVMVPQGVVTSADEQSLYPCGFETWIVPLGAPVAVRVRR
jgi:WD40 repeat protein